MVISKQRTRPGFFEPGSVARSSQTSRAGIGRLFVPVRSGQTLTLMAALSYEPKADGDSDQKGALLSASWRDADGAEITDHIPRGWSRSEKFGLFRYLGCPADRSVVHHEFDLPVPRRAISVELTLHRFANSTVSVSQLFFRR